MRFLKLLLTLAIILNTLFFTELLPAQELILRLRPGYENLKTDYGRLLFASNSIEKNTGDNLFFNSFRIIEVGEELPPAEYILSIDTVKSLYIHKQVADLGGNRTSYVSNPLLKSEDKIKIGVIDTGVDFNHPDLVDHLFINVPEDINNNGRLDQDDLNGIDDDGNGYIDDVSGYDFVDIPDDPDFGDYIDPDPWPEDEYPGGHGTAVAHAVVKGSFGNAEIVNLRAGSASGFLQEDDIARAVYYAYRNNIKILNMSFGDTRITNFLADLIEYISDNGIIVVGSAGNSKSTKPHFPSSFSSVISIGAVNSDNYRAAFSNYGFYVDIYALGEDLILAKPGGARSSFSGTSFSAPLVAGGIAAAWYKNSELSHTEMRTWVMFKAVDFGSAGWDFDYSNGIFFPSDEDTNLIKTRFRIINPHAPALYQDSAMIIVETEGLGSGVTNLLYGFEKKPEAWFDLKSDIKFGIDSTQFTDFSDQSEVVIKFSWKDENSGREINLHQQIRRVAGPPNIISWQIIPQIESSEQAYLIQTRNDQPAHLEFKNNQLRILSSTIDTIGYLPTNPKIETSYLDNEIFAVNEAGTSDKIEIPDLHFNSVLEGYFIEHELTLSSGNGFLWSEEFSGLYASSMLNESGGVEPLRFYSASNGDVVYEFADPWIIRDMTQLSNGEYRFLLGYGRYSRIVDYSVSLNDMTNSWDFPDIWSVRFYGEKVIFREDPYFHLFAFSGQNWSKVFTFNKHSQIAYFSIPGAAAVDSLIIFADMEGRVYVYEEIGDNDFVFSQNFSLAGWDPGNMLTSWSINYAGKKKNTFWAVSEIRPESITESNVDGNYWRLEGFIVEADTTYRIAELNFRGVAPRDKRWPGLGKVVVSNKTYLVVNLYPESYFLDFSDSLIIHHAHVDGDPRFNYNITSRSGNYLSNTGAGSIVRIALTEEDLSLPEPDNIRWIFQDSSLLVMRWNGLDSASFIITERISGTTDTTSHPTLRYPVNQIPFTGNFQIRQYKNNLISNWTAETTITIASFPVLNSGTFYENEYLILEFAEPIIYERSSSTLEVNPGNVRSVNLIAPNQILLKVINTISDSVRLDIKNIYSPELGAFAKDSLFFLKEKSEWMPSLISTSWEGDILVLTFNGVFADSVLLNPDKYILSPSGSIESIMMTGLNRVSLKFDHLMPLGYDYKLSFPFIVDLFGQHLRHSEILIPSPSVEDLNSIVIFPQPLKMQQHNKLTIAGLPLETKVTFFTPDGRLISKVNANVQNGKLDWNLKNELGEVVASGIYLILINYNDQKILKKALILR